jgi:hypothetical protein
MKSAAAFRKTEIQTLPSGAEVELRKPDIPRLVMESETGEIPEYLTASVLANFKKGGQVVVDFEMTAADLPRMSKFLDTVVRAALVWPRVVASEPDYDAGEILITDIDTNDRMFIFQWAMPEAGQAAQRFRPEQNGHVAAAQPVEVVSAATE